MKTSGDFYGLRYDDIYAVDGSSLPEPALISLIHDGCYFLI